jgi:hypothetical protein
MSTLVGLSHANITQGVELNYFYVVLKQKVEQVIFYLIPTLLLSELVASPVTYAFDIDTDD